MKILRKSILFLLLLTLILLPTYKASATDVSTKVLSVERDGNCTIVAYQIELPVSPLVTSKSDSVYYDVYIGGYLFCTLQVTADFNYAIPGPNGDLATITALRSRINNENSSMMYEVASRTNTILTKTGNPAIGETQITIKNKATGNIDYTILGRIKCYGSGATNK